MVVTLVDVSEGKTKNWLIFHAYVGELDRNKKFKLEFCGTDLDHNLSITDEMSEQLRQCIRDDFGSAPYNIKEAKKILKTHYSYRIERKIHKENFNTEE